MRVILCMVIVTYVTYLLTLIRYPKQEHVYPETDMLGRLSVSILSGVIIGGLVGVLISI